MDNMREQKLYGFYRGIVLKHLSRGQCKIWIPAVYPDEWNDYEKVDKLPSAEQASSLAFGAVKGNGMFSYPNIGSVVWCFFERGDQNCPVYFASTLGGEKAEKQWDKSRAMAGSHPDDAFVHHIEVGNAHILFSETGFIEVITNDAKAEDDYDKKKEDKKKEGKTCKFTMDASGNITLESSDTITLKAKNIVIDGDTQIDIVSPNIVNKASIHFNATSPAIELDSSNGHTSIKSRALYSLQNPAITSF